MEKVIIHSKTKQEFLGIMYYKCGEYFQRSEHESDKRLHRRVWERTNKSKIPQGYHVHHIDGNKSNNNSENLELLSEKEHLSHHHNGISKPISQNALKAAALWHRSSEGKQWHLNHYAEFKSKLHQNYQRICANCNKSCISQRKELQAFCTNKCKSAFRRKNKTDNITRRCFICEKDFSVNKYSKAKTCSRACSGKSRSITVSKK